VENAEIGDFDLSAGLGMPVPEPRRARQAGSPELISRQFHAPGGVPYQNV